ncbi:MAG: glycosyltransferase [Balneolia bacterium]|nr:glycosyltransferase [Balneolia bacterium]
MNKIRLSVIVPVFNRADELSALLRSIGKQTTGEGYEVIVVDDGSKIPSDTVTNQLSLEVPLFCIRQENAGPGPARNTGAAKASGEWLLFVDSDCELPETYIENAFGVLDKAEAEGISLLGGPDVDRDDFSTLQKAINYAMTSPLTTGGIRGSKKALDTYYPRTFNMLIRKSSFEKAGGFAPLRFGEDLDLSMLVLCDGQLSSFEPDLEIIHRRRSSIKAFFKQVFNSGMARIVLNKRHPGTLKLLHLMPALLIFFLLMLPVLIFYQPGVLYLCVAAALGLILHAFIRTNSLIVSFTALATSFIQLTGYGLGLLSGWYRFILQKKPVEYAFRDSFYDN